MKEHLAVKITLQPCRYDGARPDQSPAEYSSIRRRSIHHNSEFHSNESTN